MATGTIKNQHTGTWTSINANLKYQVRSGVVFVWAKGSASTSSWAAVGALPTAITPTESVYLSTYSQGNTSYGSYYINANDNKVYFFGTNPNAPALFSYPLP